MFVTSIYGENDDLYIHFIINSKDKDMKKLGRKNLDDLREIMPVVNDQELRNYVGGYDPNDCWWRCMAYVMSSGQDYSASSAMALAADYYGSNFNPNSYAFTGNYYDATSYVSNYVTSGSYCSTQILVFDPSAVSDWEGVSGNRHAVIVEGYAGNVVNIFDPQRGVAGTIDLTELNSSSGYYVNVY
jgi:natural product precursor